MITIIRGTYILLLSYNPCEIFTYFNVEQMHGLNAIDCAAHKNTTESAYIAGWCNFIPKESGEYIDDDPRFVFINLSRCTDSVSTFGLIMHELIYILNKALLHTWPPPHGALFFPLGTCTYINDPPPQISSIVILIVFTNFSRSISVLQFIFASAFGFVVIPKQEEEEMCLFSFPQLLFM